MLLLPLLLLSFPFLLVLSVVEAGHVQRAIGIKHRPLSIGATDAPSLQQLPEIGARIRKNVGLLNESCEN